MTVDVSAGLSGLSVGACEEVRRIVAERGRITPEALVDFASNPATELHSYLTWDDRHAATKRRLDEARRLIGKLRVVVITTDQKPVSVRAFVHETPPGRGRGYYSDVRLVLNDPDRRSRMLAVARRELDSFRAKYAALEGAAELLDEAARSLRKVN